MLIYGSANKSWGREHMPPSTEKISIIILIYVCKCITDLGIKIPPGVKNEEHAV